VNNGAKLSGITGTSASFWLAGVLSVLLHGIGGITLSATLIGTRDSSNNIAAGKFSLSATLRQNFPVVSGPLRPKPRRHVFGINTQNLSMSEPETHASYTHKKPLVPATDTADRKTSGTSDIWDNYLPANQLDIIPTPIADADSSLLDGMLFEKSMVYLKLYIDKSGAVRRVLIDIPDSEQAAAEPIKTMFTHTGFVPGRKNGQPVPSVLPIVIDISELSGLRKLD
jgi:hypothetical protein